MLKLPDPAPTLKPSIVAALVLAALDQLQQLATPLSLTAAEVVTLTGSSRSQAYEMKGRLLAACATLHESAGRPPSGSPSSEARVTVLEAVRDWLFAHPGAVVERAHRREYSHSFCRFGVALTATDGLAANMTAAALSQAVGVPLGTLKDWLARPDEVSVPSSPSLADAPDDPTELAVHADTATILLTYSRWDGGFAAFCDHLRREHGLKCGRSYVSSVLEAAGLRLPKRRGAPKQAPWSRDTFRRLFPGAQWIGDGTELAIELDGERFVFNLEAIVDTHTNAAVGVDVGDTENEMAVLTAFHSGLITTGEHPLAFTVDNKPSNLTEWVHDSIAPTEVLRATPGRGQAKAPIEGLFGLFEQTAPPLTVRGDTPREHARSILALCCTLWLWARNGRPRRRLGGRSPIDVYRNERPQPGQIEDARRWIAELKSRSEKARQTAEARTDPVRRTLLREGLARLGIEDLAQDLEIALAPYACEAIVRGLATYEAKAANGTVPKDADPGRYLGGIIRNLSDRLELQATADCLLDLRIRQRDLTLDRVCADFDQLRRTATPAELPAILAERALEATTQPAIRFYTRKAAAAIAALSPNIRGPIVRPLVKLASKAFGAHREVRADLIAELTAAVSC